MSAEPKMPEPVAYVDDLSRPQPHCVTSLKYCSVLQHQRGDHLRYTPVVTRESAQAYAEALVAQERERCAKLRSLLQGAEILFAPLCRGATTWNWLDETRAALAKIEVPAESPHTPPETGKEK